MVRGLPRRSADSSAREPWPEWEESGVTTPPGCLSYGGLMAGKFVLKRSTNGKFHFNLQAGNGEIIATSELYESKASALNGIDSVRRHAADAVLDDRCDAPVPKQAKKPQAKPASAARLSLPASAGVPGAGARPPARSHPARVPRRAPHRRP